VRTKYTERQRIRAGFALALARIQPNVLVETLLTQVQLNQDVAGLYAHALVHRFRDKLYYKAKARGEVVR